MLSAGIVRSDNALVVSFVKLFLFPNLLSCILFAWTCFFIATISTGPSSWGDPLPMTMLAHTKKLKKVQVGCCNLCSNPLHCTQHAVTNRASLPTSTLIGQV